MATLTLDPSEVATNRTALVIEPDGVAGPIRVGPDGPDWGTAEITAYMAEASRGSLPVDFRIPNRTVSVPLQLGAHGATTFAQAREQLEQKVALFQREGGWLKADFGTPYFLDVVNASLVLGHGQVQVLTGFDADVALTLECVPDFYGAEVDLGDNVETTNPELIWTETGILGTYPGRLRLVVDNDASVDQLGLIAAVRSRHYSSASTARLVYEAEALTPLDTAAIATRTGASGGGSNNVIRHSNLSTEWTPVLGTTILSGTASMTHTGSYRVWARVYSADVSSTVGVKLRFVWDVGDLTLSVENAAVSIPGASNFYLVDLGEIRLDQVPVGTHRWQGEVQAKGTVGGEDIDIDRLWFAPIDEMYAPLRSSVSISPGGFATYSARSEFNTEGGVITGDSLTVGGTWTGGGDATDFSVGSGVATRSEISDVAETGRVIYASTPSALTNAMAKVDLKTSQAGIYQGLVLRSTATGTNIRVMAISQTSPANTVIISCYGYVAGVWQGAAVGGFSSQLSFLVNTYYTLQAMVIATGQFIVWFGPQGGAPQPVLAGSSTLFATGGTLASGSVGLYDEYRAASPAATRTYDNFAAWVPAPDAVMYANQSAQLTTDGHFRENSAGTAYGPVSQVLGDLPRLPPAGSEGRTAEFLVKGSRGDFDRLPDTALDDISARAFYRPSWLFPPGS